MKFIKSTIFSILFCMIIGTLLNAYMQQDNDKEISVKESRQKMHLKNSSIAKNNLKFPSVD